MRHLCKCIMEPRGEYGLEGYAMGDWYSCEQMQNAKGIYYRVYPNLIGNYHETCGPIVFKRFFKIAMREKVLDPPCILCGYNHENYWEKHSHDITCPFYHIAGAKKRHKLLTTFVESV